MLNLGATVHLVEPGSIERSAGKAKCKPTGDTAKHSSMPTDRKAD